MSIYAIRLLPDEVRDQATDFVRRADAMASQSGQPVEARQVRILTQQESSIGAERSQAGPAVYEGRMDEPREEAFDLGHRQVFDVLVDLRSARGRICLVARAEEQAAGLGADVVALIDVPGEGPGAIHGGQVGRDEEVAPARVEERRVQRGAGSCHTRCPGTGRVNDLFRSRTARGSW